MLVNKGRNRCKGQSGYADMWRTLCYDHPEVPQKCEGIGDQLVEYGQFVVRGLYQSYSLISDFDFKILDIPHCGGQRLTMPPEMTAPQ